MRWIIASLVAVPLAGCVDSRPPPQTPAPSPAADSQPAASDTAGSQYDPINRANAVEGDVLEQKEAGDAQMESQGG